MPLSFRVVMQTIHVSGRRRDNTRLAIMQKPEPATRLHLLYHPPFFVRILFMLFPNTLSSILFSSPPYPLYLCFQTQTPTHPTYNLTFHPTPLPLFRVSSNFYFLPFRLLKESWYDLIIDTPLPSINTFVNQSMILVFTWLLNILDFISFLLHWYRMFVTYFIAFKNFLPSSSIQLSILILVHHLISQFTIQISYGSYIHSIFYSCHSQFSLFDPYYDS